MALGASAAVAKKASQSGGADFYLVLHAPVGVLAQRLLMQSLRQKSGKKNFRSEGYAHDGKSGKGSAKKRLASVRRSVESCGCDQ